VAQNSSVRKVKRALLLASLPELAMKGTTGMEGPGARLESQRLFRGASQAGRENTENKGQRPRMWLWLRLPSPGLLCPSL